MEFEHQQTTVGVIFIETGSPLPGILASLSESGFWGEGLGVRGASSRVRTEGISIKRSRPNPRSARDPAIVAFALDQRVRANEFASDVWQVVHGHRYRTARLPRPRPLSLSKLKERGARAWLYKTPIRTGAQHQTGYHDYPWLADYCCKSLICWSKSCCIAGFPAIRFFISVSC